MRLQAIRSGHAFKEKIQLKLMGFMMKQPVPDVLKTLLYRPAFFGRPFSDLIQRSLRQPSEWSVGERELFAAYVSKLNDCRF